MRLEPRPRSHATGDEMGSLCPETQAGLCSGTQPPLPSTESSDLRGARMIQIKVRMLFGWLFKWKQDTQFLQPDYLSQAYQNSQKRKNRKREKQFFICTQLAWWSENRGCLEEMNLALSYQQSMNQFFLNCIYLFLFIYLAELGLSCGMCDLPSSLRHAGPLVAACGI